MKTLLTLTVFAALVIAPATTARAQNVAVTEDEASFTLSNGIMTARVLKRNGDMSSLTYRGREVLTDKSGHAGAYWSHDTTGGTRLSTRITIDPKTNGGERAEVSVKGISGGVRMGHGPGAAADGDFPADIEIRYTLNRGDSGIYTYCFFDHRPEYPAATMTEARFAAKLAATFDWMTVDANRDMYFPPDLHEGDKYMYTAVQFENRTFGWSSTKDRLGFWVINPSVEFMSGGPTKVDFLSHRDTTAVAAPVVFNYWRSSHYGGAAVDVGAGERWTKTIGPFFLYVNEGGDPQALASDARARQVAEAGKWPYDWVAGVDYAHRNERATVKGRILLRDPQAPGTRLPNLLVGLTVASYASPYPRPNATGAPRQIDWQTDAKHYQFWVHGEEDGTFAIPHVPPGTYTLRAFADGSPRGARARERQRRGRQAARSRTGHVDAGAPRPAALGSGRAEPHRHRVCRRRSLLAPGDAARVCEAFPNDVRFVVGTSAAAKDWFFQQVPHNENPAADPLRGGASGRATPYAISFDLASAQRGRAILRVALCGGGAREVEVTVNGQAVGKIDRLQVDGAINRHSIQGLWYEREVTFDATMLKAGTNVVTLTVPAGPVNNGVIYDYLRLEVDDLVLRP
jgi:rhamnogalacturonan endolyase